VLASIYRQQVIDSRYLQGILKTTPYDVLTRVTPPNAIMNPSDLWGVLDNEIHTALSWIITAPLDVFAPVVGPLVRTKVIRVGFEDLLQVGGVAYRKGAPLDGVAGVKVSIAGTAFEAETNAKGQFTFVDVPAGDYTWRIQTDGKAKEQKVRVPSASYDIEV
jgi:hypothetical protein